MTLFGRWRAMRAGLRDGSGGVSAAPTGLSVRAALRRLDVLVTVLFAAAALPVLLYAERTAILVLLPAGWVTRRAMARWPRLQRPAGWCAGLLIAAAAAGAWLDWRINYASAVAALSEFLIATCLARMAIRRPREDAGMLLTVALVLLVIGGVVNVRIIYPVVLATFVALGPLALLLHHHLRELGRWRRRCERLGVAPVASAATVTLPADLSRRAAWMSLTGAVIGVVGFVVFPPLKTRAMEMRLVESIVRSGMGSDPDLHRGGEVVSNDEIVMRVWLRQGDKVLGPADIRPYFRMYTLDLYDPRGRSSWRRRLRGLSGLEAVEVDGVPRCSVLPLSGETADVALIEQRYEVYRPRGVLAALYPPVEVRGDVARRLRTSPVDHALVARFEREPERLEYTVLSAAMLTRPVQDVLAAVRRPEAIQPPDSSEIDATPRTRALVEEFVSEVPNLTDPANQLRVVNRIQQYLQSPEFRYDKEAPRIMPEDDPVDAFLFEHRAGHCEYFASAMTVLCQLAGLPARFVVGYLGSEYSQSQQCFIVRERDAHAWCEVYIPGREWVRVEATPEGAIIVPEASPLAWLRDYFQYLQFQWINILVGYDAEQRRETLAAIGGWLASVGSAVRAGDMAALGRALGRLVAGPAGAGPVLRGAYWALLGTCALVLFRGAAVGVRAVRVKRRPRASDKDDHGAAGALFRDLARLARRHGHVRRPSCTPRQFALDLVARDPRWRPAMAVVDALYAERFGGRRLDASTVERLRAEVIAAGQALKNNPPRR